MIQRIQSIFLLLSGGTFFAQFGLPFATSETAGGNYLSDAVYNIQDHTALLVLAILGGALALGAIFLFKNRPLQMRLSYLVIVLSIILPVAAAMLFLQAGNSLDGSSGINDGFGLYMPILGIIFTILAIRFIKKDDNLVRSMDRLR